MKGLREQNLELYEVAINDGKVVLCCCVTV